MIRILSLIFLAIGTIYCLSNIRDEIRGRTSVYSPIGARSSLSVVPYRENKGKNAKSFRDAMTYQWIYAISLIALGLIGQSIQRHADKSDPFSSSFNFPDTSDNKDKKT